MAKLVFGMNVSLDGYVDHDHPAFPPPGPRLFRHFIERVGSLSGSIYGRRMYELMRVWDDDGWNGAEGEFAEAWRKQPKWVVSRTLFGVGPNATLLQDDLETTVRRLKSEFSGVIEVAGTKLAHSLGELGLVDEYDLYFHPVVLGGGTPFFAGPRPPLRLTAHEMMDERVIRLTYVPA